MSDRRGRDPDRPVRVAALCFIPDAGHVAPILRVAGAAERAGLEVRCFVPEETARMVRSFGLEAGLVGRHRPGDAGEVLGRVARRHGWPASVIGARTLVSRYLVPIHVSLLEGLDEALASVADFDPDVILADDHFEVCELHRRIAAALGAPILWHFALGSSIRDQPVAVRRWGVPERWWTRLAVRLDPMIRAWYPRWQRLFDRDEWNESRRIRHRLEELEASRAPVPEPPVERRVATGIGVVEQEELGRWLHPPRGVALLGPAVPRRDEAIDDALLAWLEGSDAPVSLVSFGTLLDPGRDVTTAVVDGLRRAGSRVLLVSSAGAGGERGVADTDVRREPFVPQPEVLDHPSVRLFVTHAGSGGVQEALWAGTPMLCVPLLWDQPYNASIVEALGAGVRLRPARVSRRSIERAARSLLDEGRFTERARALSRRLRELESGDEVVRILRDLAEYDRDPQETADDPTMRSGRGVAEGVESP